MSQVRLGAPKKLHPHPQVRVARAEKHGLPQQGDGPLRLIGKTRERSKEPVSGRVVPVPGDARLAGVDCVLELAAGKVELAPHVVGCRVLRREGENLGNGVVGLLQVALRVFAPRQEDELGQRGRLSEERRDGMRIDGERPLERFSRFEIFSRSDGWRRSHQPRMLMSTASGVVVPAC